MKKLFAAMAILVLNVFTADLQAQSIGVNTTSPDVSAALDVASQTKGLLVPRMNTAARNAIANPQKGLMVFDSVQNNFYFYSGASWTAVGAAATGPGLQLLADKTGGTGETLNLAGSTATIIAFNNVTSAPSGGNTWTGNNTFTVGTGQGGVYMIQVRLHGPDASPATNSVSYSLAIQINGIAYGSVGNVYGIYPAIDVYTPAGTKTRGEIIAFIKLNAYDTFKILGVSANSSTNAQPISTDAGSNIMVMKMN